MHEKNINVVAVGSGFPDLIELWWKKTVVWPEKTIFLAATWLCDGLGKMLLSWFAGFWGRLLLCPVSSCWSRTGNGEVLGSSLCDLGGASNVKMEFSDWAVSKYDLSSLCETISLFTVQGRQDQVQFLKWQYRLVPFPPYLKFRSEWTDYESGNFWNLFLIKGITLNLVNFSCFHQPLSSVSPSNLVDKPDWLSCLVSGIPKILDFLGCLPSQMADKIPLPNSHSLQTQSLKPPLDYA